MELREETFTRPGALELRVLELAAPSPPVAETLRQEASRWLTHAQREFHDALFARDGSQESLDRYASARAELDSAEEWALRVARALHGG